MSLMCNFHMPKSILRRSPSSVTMMSSSIVLRTAVGVGEQHAQHFYLSHSKVLPIANAGTLPQLTSCSSGMRNRTGQLLRELTQLWSSVDSHLKLVQALKIASNMSLSSRLVDGAGMQNSMAEVEHEQQYDRVTA